MRLSEDLDSPFHGGSVSLVPVRLMPKPASYWIISSSSCLVNYDNELG